MKRKEEEEEERFGRGATMHARSVPGDDGRQKKLSVVLLLVLPLLLTRGRSCCYWCLDLAGLDE